MADLVRQVIDDMHSCGIVPTDPGVIQFDLPTMTRFHVAGDKKGTMNGFWRGFSDGIPAGVFGSWKTGAQHNWTMGSADKWSDSDKAAFTAKIERIKAEREALQAQAQGEVAKAATERFNSLPDASPDQGYCLKKHITPMNAKQQNTFLVLAIVDWSGAIHSLQTIAPNGRKMMLKGGAKKGFHIHIGGNPEGRLLVCEGYATGCSLAKMDPDAEVVAAVDAYNIRSVAQAARERFPTREIVLCGDHDPVGVRCATAAARAINGKVLIPPTVGMDWNDYALALEASR
ncbi:toprim domain-containing protein [Acidithiobacillus sp.]|uniref:toprim domain-containing protein n=1 Tax=Acidithiobacillus sp. TaxID=1872118 RepID=UPI0025C22043|nr:toprim domain-containing protein [Acidithiobacillus sp.]